MFLLRTDPLVDVYSYIASFIALILSYTCSRSYMMESFGDTSQVFYAKDDVSNTVAKNIWLAFQILPLQLLFGYLFVRLWEHRENSESYTDKGRLFIQIGTNISLIFPFLLNLFLTDISVFLKSLIVSLSFPLLILLTDIILTIHKFARDARFFHNIQQDVQNLGIQGLIEQHWMRLRIPKLLRIFFTIRLLCQFGYFYHMHMTENNKSNDTADIFNSSVLYNVSVTLTVKTCDNTVALMGFTSIISFFVHYLGLLLAFCVGSTDEDDRNMGTVSAILFFILALQTGLTGLNPTARLTRLNKNMYLLGTAITHFVHSMVHPLLMTLSASHNRNIKSHLRLLIMCAMLVILPTILLFYLWSFHSVSTWLLAVTAFSLEVILKVMISLMVYLLFLYDAYRDKFWEGLDDYVYYIQSTGNSIEFMFGIFLFCNGGWILIFESGGTIRAFMMCIHAYFNIWLQAKKGWKVFIQRKSAVNKINSLPMSQPSEIPEGDVCAICYQELLTARVTQCKHYFHSLCLRKWLYVQDNCPLCHQVIYTTESNENMSANNQTDIDRVHEPHIINPDEHEHQE